MPKGAGSLLDAPLIALEDIWETDDVVFLSGQLRKAFKRRFGTQAPCG
jgi:hypothetical protein